MSRFQHKKHTVIVVVAASALTMMVYALGMSMPFNLAKPCLYEGIKAKCGELIVTTTTHGHQFDEALANIQNQTAQLGGSIEQSDRELNRIIIQFVAKRGSLPNLKRQLEAMPDVHSVAYSPISVSDESDA